MEKTEAAHILKEYMTDLFYNPIYYVYVSPGEQSVFKDVSNCQLETYIYMMSFMNMSYSIEKLGVEPLSVKELAFELRKERRTVVRDLACLEESELVYLDGDRVYPNLPPGEQEKAHPLYMNRIIMKAWYLSQDGDDPRMGRVMKLAPYINYKHNVVCKNPDEEDFSKIIPLSYQEILSLMSLRTKESFLELVDYPVDTCVGGLVVLKRSTDTKWGDYFSVNNELMSFRIEDVIDTGYRIRRAGLSMRSIDRYPLHFGIVYSSYLAPGNFVSLDERLFIPLMDSIGDIKFLRYLYAYLKIDKTHGVSQVMLRKILELDKETFSEELKEMMTLEILVHWKTNIVARKFPGVEYSKERWNSTVHTHRLDVDKFITCYESFRNDKMMMTCLARCFRIMCWANMKYGVICKFPGDLNLGRMKPMTKSEICKILKITNPTYNKFVESTSKKKTLIDGSSIRLFYSTKLDGGKSGYMVSPDLFYHEYTDPMIYYSANDPDFIVRDFDKVFFEKESDIRKDWN